MRRQDYKKALGLLDRAVEARPDDGAILMLLGITLAQVGRAHEATDALRKATVRLPNDSRPFANLAVHLLDQKNPAEAEAMAREALKIDPDDPSALDVLAKISAAAESAGVFEAAGGPLPAESAAVAKFGGRWKGHVLPALDGREMLWDGIGIMLLVLGLAATVLLVTHTPFTAPDWSQKDAMASSNVRQDPLSIAGIVTWVVASLGSLAWTVFDMIDRKARFIWLVPQVICGFFGLAFVPLSLYLWLGRNL